ncbi:carbon-monoxide dehydrogenase catalytic subunit [Methanococcus voltae PS]|uniref:Carbon monoxide dehydrogenase n=1 Tax=Methanococcus voltae PS TaxID=523842 RepID=A0ABT2EXU1_METVO|nr:anaerobic carbon-monoxide dehydrogenase catalytic subunit [Methanococcus voltae]MCS3922256.1 carbon-monoxide dehydrogenase catalytic subunit [Methanococcus voltae PS]
MKKVSEHDSINEMYQKLIEDNMSNIFDREDQQETVRCGFCSQGMSCQLCSNGPCRITPIVEGKRKIDSGACGIGPDAMAMRYMLLRNVMGTSTYTYHAKEAFRTLKSTAEGRTPFEIQDINKLKTFANACGLKVTSVNETAVNLAKFLYEQTYTSRPSIMVERFAPKPRQDLWNKLGIYPAGPQEEMLVSTSSCLTNVDSDYVSLALKAMRLGISCIYGAQIGLEMVQDILYGTPMPHKVDVDLGIVDPEYINIVVNGHEPFVGAALINMARSSKIQERAGAEGAKGLRIVGSIETGQELIQRFNVDDVFVGLTGNWITIEPLLATNAVDVFAMDMNCSLPRLNEYSKKYNTTLISVSKLVKLPHVSINMDYEPHKVEKMAEEIINIAFKNYKNRKSTKSHVPNRKTEAIVGVSTEAILNILGGSLDPLLNAIKDGDIKGVVALISCTSIHGNGHDMNTVAIAKELIKKDILVVSAGCGNAALQVAGLTSLDAIDMAGSKLAGVCKLLKIPPVLSFGTCTDTGRISMLVTELTKALNVDTKDLPIAVTAPEYMEQKATIDALFALGFGLYTHVSPLPPVTGGESLVKLLTNDLENLTGAKLDVETDMVKAASNIESHINKKRSRLGI